MKKHFPCLFIFLCLIQSPIQAEDKSLEDQIAEAKELLEQEKIISVELKAEIAARETEAETLKQKLKEIEDKIEALKKEHGLK
jgi:septal ring factor EnvC (AmiA/AmiB activator)